jgi:hypothetical protein
MNKGTIATVVGTATMLLIAGAAFAGKPSSSLSLVVLPSDGVRTAATVAPSWGGEITFDVTTTETDRPFVNVRCYQGTSFVYDGWHGFFASYVPEPVFTLAAPGYWEGGAADCTARLVTWRNGRERTLATTTFRVAA